MATCLRRRKFIRKQRQYSKSDENRKAMPREAAGVKGSAETQQTSNSRPEPPEGTREIIDDPPGLVVRLAVTDGPIWSLDSAFEAVIKNMPPTTANMFLPLERK